MSSEFDALKRAFEKANTELAVDDWSMDSMPDAGRPEPAYRKIAFASRVPSSWPSAGIWNMASAQSSCSDDPVHTLATSALALRFTSEMLIA